MECCLVIRRALGAVVFVCICSAVQAQHDDRSVFSVLPMNITARLGFPARFDCQTNTSGFIRWARGTNLQMITSGTCNNCTMLSNGSLWINIIDQSHAGLYVCFIVGGSVQPSYNVYLTVAEAPMISLISNVTPAGDLMFPEGGTLQINVSVTGIPQPNITWRRNNVVIDERDPGVMITGANLSLSNVRRADAGEYAITAVNIANTAVERYDVIIQFKPIITISRRPDSEMVEDGVMVTVTCSVISHPQSAISWWQIAAAAAASEMIDRTTPNTTEHSNSGNDYTTSTSNITFNASDINGFSKFCCTASNEIGMDTKCLNFTETGTPLAPTYFNYTGVTSSTVTVSWVSSYTMGDSNIQYRLSWYTSGNSMNSVTLPSDQVSYTIENLRPDTEYMLTINIINTDNGKENFAGPIPVRTLVTVPGVVRNFSVEVIGEEGIFRLTWQAPNGSQVDHYIIYMRMMDGETSLTTTVSNSTSYNYTFNQENRVYEFAVQAVNNGSKGNISNYMAVFYCSTNPLLNVTHQRFTQSVNVVWTLISRFNSSGIYLIVTRRRDNAEFTTDPILDGRSSQCIDNLEPSTDYSITILATFNCGNVSSAIDFRTLSGSSSSDGGPSSEDCIKYVPGEQEGGEPEETSDSGLEPWIIAVIVTVPIVAFVIMLTIGIICALQKKASSKDLGGLPAENNATRDRVQQEQQQLFSYRNNSTSTYTNGSTSDYRSGSASPTRSNLSYNSKPGVWPYRNPSVDVGSTINENSSAATSV